MSHQLTGQRPRTPRLAHSQPSTHKPPCSAGPPSRGPIPGDAGWSRRVLGRGGGSLPQGSRSWPRTGGFCFMSQSFSSVSFDINDLLLFCKPCRPGGCWKVLQGWLPS